MEQYIWIFLGGTGSGNIPDEQSHQHKQSLSRPAKLMSKIEVNEFQTIFSPNVYVH